MNAAYSNPLYRPPVVRLRAGRLVGLLVLVLALVAGGGYWLLKAFGKPLTTTPVETPAPTTWLKKAAYPTADTPPLVGTVPPQDRTAEIMRQLAAMQKQLEEQAAALDALRRSRTTVQPQQAQTAKAPPTKPPRAGMLYVSHDLKETPPGPKAHEYTLAPGATKLPCVIETAMNSDVPGYFIAKVSQNVYDTATGRHLLVPQGSSILGHDQSQTLVYGNERMDTVSLKLTLPDGRTVDLGKAPVTDQQGIAGLADHVDQHYGRLLAAVLIQGVLRGGMTAVTTAVTNASGAGQVASGIAGVGNQASTQVTGPMLNTRPTITVDAGKGCAVLLLEPLHLPTMWQDGQPLEPMATAQPMQTRRVTP